MWWGALLPVQSHREQCLATGVDKDAAGRGRAARGVWGGRRDGADDPKRAPDLLESLQEKKRF